jgi:hypothetical protein
MSPALLPTALRAIGRELGDDDPAARVRRADLDRRDRLVIELDSPAGSRWFRFDETQLEELRLESEQRLPLAVWHGAEPGPRTVLSWRPGRRLVLGVPLPTGHQVWKGQRPSHLAAAAARHLLGQSLVRGERGADEGFRIPELLGVDAERAALRLAFASGFEPPIRPVDAPDFERIGRALRSLQDRGDVSALDLRQQLSEHGPEQELAVIDERVRRARRCLEAAPAGLESVLDRLRRAIPSPLAPVPCHRDLHDRQILLGAGAPVLLDLDLLCLADPLLDVANLLAHLALRRLQGAAEASPEGVRACGDALLAGLGRGQLESFLPRLRFYQAAALLRLAALYSLRPRWAPLTADLVRLAERCAAETTLSPI